MVENIEVLSGQTKIEHILKMTQLPMIYIWFIMVYHNFLTAQHGTWLTAAMMRRCHLGSGRTELRQPAAATAARAAAVGAPPHLGNKGLQILFGFFDVFLWFLDCFSVWGTFPCYLLHLEQKPVLCWIWELKFAICAVHQFSMVLLDFSMVFIDLPKVFIDCSIVFLGYNWFFHGFNRFFFA